MTDVTDGRFTDTDPVFTIDGKYLAFLSKRSFDPVYDAHFFDLAFPYGARPYLLPLAAATLSPFGPRPGGRASATGRRVRRQPGSGDGGSDSASRARGRTRRRTARRKAAAMAARPGSVAVDLDGLAGRIVRCRCPSPGTPRCARSRAAWPGCASRWPAKLGRGRRPAGDSGPRPALERFDFAPPVGHRAGGRRRLVRGQRRRHPAGGQGRRQPDRAARRPQGRLRQPRRPGQRGRLPGQVPGRSGRAVAARVRRGRADHPARLLGPGPGRRGLGRRAGPVPAAAGPGRPARASSPTCSGRPSASWAPRTPTSSRPAARDGSAGSPRSACSAPTWSATATAAGGCAGSCPASPPTRGRARRSAAPGVQVRPGDRLLAVDGRPVAADGPGPLLAGVGGQAGRADRDRPAPAASRGGSWWCRWPASGGCATRTGWPAGAAVVRELGQRPDRLPARAGHGQRGLGRLPPRPARRDDPGRR